MTDRLKGLTVVLESDMRDDDAQAVIEAISMIRGVLKVHPILTDSMDYIDHERIKSELRQQLWDVLK